jgi:hypothetical protein
MQDEVRGSHFGGLNNSKVAHSFVSFDPNSLRIADMGRSMLRPYTILPGR